MAPCLEPPTSPTIDASINHPSFFMATRKKTAQNPLILQCSRLMEAFAKSNDEQDFYLERYEGFILYIDLDKSEEQLNAIQKELEKDPERYCQIPKLTFYESKKIMEGFVHEKVYDIDTKEKLQDIIQGKEARENFLEMIYDNHNELEKWQQYYQERSRIRIIEWLRNNEFVFVFEEDLDLTRNVIEKLKKNLFTAKVGKDVAAARKILASKSKTYYSSEALNPRPKRGRPPKQTAKVEAEPQLTVDIYTTVTSEMRPFLFTPEITSKVATFSAKFSTEEELLASLRSGSRGGGDPRLESLNQKLAALRQLSGSTVKSKATFVREPESEDISDFELEDEDLDFDLEEETPSAPKKKAAPKKPAAKKAPAKKTTTKAKKK